MRTNKIEMLVARGKALPENVRLEYIEHFVPGDVEVATIRERYAAGELQRNLAAQFGVTQPAISMIVNRTRRKR